MADGALALEGAVAIGLFMLGLLMTLPAGCPPPDECSPRINVPRSAELPLAGPGLAVGGVLPAAAASGSFHTTVPR